MLRLKFTFFYLLSGELLVGPGGPLHDVGEPDPEADQLPVVVRVHRARDQTGQEQAFPWKEKSLEYCSLFNCGD